MLCKLIGRVLSNWSCSCGADNLDTAVICWSCIKPKPSS